MEAQRLQAEEELKANGGKPDEAERERVAITDLCRALKVEMKEINPDGHCLYAAVADQLNILGKAHGKIGYSDTRKATAEYMRTHSDDFMPFISDSDEHMAGIENKEAGQQSANVSQQESELPSYPNPPSYHLTLSPLFPQSISWVTAMQLKRLPSGAVNRRFWPYREHFIHRSTSYRPALR